MKRWISFALLAAMLLGLCTACTPPEEAPAAKPSYEGKSVAFIGDSITYGIGLENLTGQYWQLLKNNMHLGLRGLYARQAPSQRSRPRTDGPAHPDLAGGKRGTGFGELKRNILQKNEKFS